MTRAYLISKKSQKAHHWRRADSHGSFRSYDGWAGRGCESFDDTPWIEDGTTSFDDAYGPPSPHQDARVRAAVDEWSDSIYESVDLRIDACAMQMARKDLMTTQIGNREMRALSRLAAKQGWKVKFTGGGHLKWIPPKMASGFQPGFIITSATPDTQQSFDNAKKDLERAGLVTNASEVKALTKPDTAEAKDTEVADPYCCRNIPCRARFETTYSRDRHEFHECEHRPAKPKAKKPTRECPVCHKQISFKNLPAHVARKHAADGWVWVRGHRDRDGYAAQTAKRGSLATDRPPDAPTTRDTEAVVAMLVETLFPEGLPLNRGAVLRALADWSEATEKFLNVVSDGS